MVKKLFLLFIFAVVSAAALTTVNAQSSPKDVVAAFYKYDRAHSADAVNESTVEARKRWFSAELYGLFIRHLESEKKMLVGDRATDKPLFGDGFPFQPIREPCEMTNGSSGLDYLYSVGRGSINVDRAKVRVKFFYPRQCKPAGENFEFRLVKNSGRWRIDDVRYRNGDSLRDSLKDKN